MAEVKNAFVSSKMNLDLDDRLIPQGQYREGVNIQVSKSEGPNVGALENVLGNQLLKNFVALTGGITGLQIIGEVTDPTNNTFYFFLTDYREPDPTGITFSSNANNYIYSYNVLTEQTVQLVSGSFLNFSITSPIYGVNIVENLLFWTDNRNQPRKINLSYSPGYYTTEDHISVAKIMPINVINLYQQSSVAAANNAYECTMQDVISPNLPDGATVNPYLDANYPGDPDFLEDKFVRFSYRFKFDDNEYSVLAPFTQECFIPKQDGYFLPGDQESTYRSTIVSFMENKINKIILKIPLPLAINGTAIVGSALNSTLKIKEIDIIYKESDSQAVQVVDTILSDSFSLETTSNISYTYQCTKPYKTLPESALVRVYDKVPVRAFSQEVSGNRVIYGNFQDKHTPPQQPLDYQVGAFDKSNFFQSATDNTLNTTSLVEYPNHTLKQNRNYQVGLVLSDRYGRSSTTLLSKENTAIAAGEIESFGASTYYHPYRISTDTSVSSWPGDALKIFFNSALPTKIINLPQGLPGEFQGQTSDITNPYNPLGWYSYKVVVKQFEQEYYNVYLPGALNAYPGGVNPTGDAANSTAFITLINDNINKVPRDLNEVGPDQKQFRSSVRLFGRVENTNLSGTQYVSNTLNLQNPAKMNDQYYSDNQSHTVSTISTLQDLFDYNPNDRPSPSYFPQFYLLDSNPLVARLSTANKIGQIATLNYNPGEAQINAAATTPIDYPAWTDTTPVTGNIPIKNISGSIATNAIVTGIGIPEGTYVAIFNVATASNPAKIGLNNAVVLSTNDVLYFAPGRELTLGNRELTIPGIQYLSVYETEPVNSLLDIFWETTTTGIISDLNTLILNSSDAAGGVGLFTPEWDETITTNDNIFNAPVFLVDAFGTNLPVYDATGPTAGVFNIELGNVLNLNNTNVQSFFELTYTNSGTAAGSFNIKPKPSYIDNIFFSTDQTVRLFNFEITVVTKDVDGVASTNVIAINNSPLGPINVSPVTTQRKENGNVVPQLSAIIRSNRTQVSSPIVEINAHNGAGNTSLRTSDFDYTLLSFNDLNAPAGSQSVLNSNYFQLDQSVESSTSTKIGAIKLLPNQNMPASRFQFVLAARDAGGQGQQVTYSSIIDLRVQPASVTTAELSCLDEPGGSQNNNYPIVLIGITGAGIGQNGYYLFPTTGIGNLDDGNNTITINNTDAVTSTGGSCPNVPTIPFFVSGGLTSTTKNAVYTLYAGIGGSHPCTECGAAFSTPVTETAVDITGYSFEIV